MEISNAKTLEIDVTLDMKKVHGYNIVMSSIFIHWKEVPPDQVPITTGMALYESTTSISFELHAVKVFIFGDKDGLKKRVLWQDNKQWRIQKLFLLGSGTRNINIV